MNTTPIVSIIIPCYNQGKFLSETLCSIQAQVLRDWEGIIVDDGSTDDSVRVAQSFIDNDTRFRLICKKNGGSASARNVGLKVARGKYIQFLDADDLLVPDKLEKQVEYMQSHHIKVCCTNYRMFFTQTDTKKTYYGGLKWWNRWCPLSRCTVLTWWGVVFSYPIHTFLYDHLFLSQYNLFFDEQKEFLGAEDWNFCVDLCKHTSVDVSMNTYIGCFYRHNIEGKTATDPLRFVDDILKFIFYRFNNFKWYERLLWTYRLSEELWKDIGRMFKYRTFKCLGLWLDYLYGKNIFFVIVAIVLSPITFVQICLTSLFVYSFPETSLQNQQIGAHLK